MKGARAATGRVALSLLCARASGSAGGADPQVNIVGDAAPVESFVIGMVLS